MVRHRQRMEGAYGALSTALVMLTFNAGWNVSMLEVSPHPQPVIRVLNIFVRFMETEMSKRVMGQPKNLFTDAAISRDNQSVINKP